MGILANSASVAMTSSAASDSRPGFVAGERIVLSVNPSGTNYSWSQAGPPGSSTTRAALSQANSAAPSFVPDIAGTYTLVCTVDAVTTYVLRLTVTQVITATSTEALRLSPLRDEQVAAPVLGFAIYHSESLGAPAYKSPDNSVRPLGSTQILDLFATSQAQVPAVATAPGWTVIGGFRMLITTDIRLEAIGAVSDPSLTMTVRLFCTTPGALGVVAGSLTDPITSTTDVETLSGSFTLPGNRLYQVQAQVVGNLGGQYFGTVRRTAPANSAPVSAGVNATCAANVISPYATISASINKPSGTIIAAMAATVTAPTAACTASISAPATHATMAATVPRPVASFIGSIAGSNMHAAMAAIVTSPTASCVGSIPSSTFLPGYLEYYSWGNADYLAGITRKQFVYAALI